MQVTPVGKKILFEIEVPKAGALDLSNKPSAKERGTITAVGSEVTKFKVGDVVLVKAWAVDIIDLENKKYYFIDEDHPGLCALVTE